jgi:hypothetical protein
MRERRHVWFIGLRLGGRARLLVTGMLLAVLVGGIVFVPEHTLVGQTADPPVFDSIYYNALLSGRDADAALRKAHYLTGSLMQHFGMTRSEAAAEVARTMVMRSGLLCSGG